MDGCLLGGRSAAIDPRVVRDELGIVVALFLVLGDQPAGPRVRAAVGREPLDVTGGRVLVPLPVRDKMISASGCGLKCVSTCLSSTVICSFGAVSTAASARTTAAPPAVTCGG